jgi:Transglycosylase SLT domain
MRRFLPLLILLIPVAATASPPPSPSTLCDAAIQGAEGAGRLPLRLLGAIAEVESGRLDAAGQLRPWPWTIDAEGRGQFFATKQQAIAAVRALQAQGVQSIDVGCMQVNLMYHPNAFASLDQAFDPTANALYATRFLNALYASSGSWVQATAAYHSQTPAIGAGYQQRVMARWQHGTPLLGASLTPTAYRDFKPESRVYGAFEPTDRVYGAFADPGPSLTRLAHR